MSARPWLVQDRPWLGHRANVADFGALVEADDPPGPVTQPLTLEDEAHRAECARSFDTASAVLLVVAVCLALWGAVAYVLGGVQ